MCDHRGKSTFSWVDTEGRKQSITFDVSPLTEKLLTPIIADALYHYGLVGGSLTEKEE
jgi:hypothetical protein